VPIALKQRVKFRKTSAADLFDIYMDSGRHSEAIGAPVSVRRKPGSAFAAFGRNGIKGKTLHVVPGQLVVQTWRSNAFVGSDPDSIVALVFSDTDGGGQIDLVHVNIPTRLFENTNVGWKSMYWRRWHEYLRRARPLSEPRR
jgi:uncharacterized protein YndB with AHSA1/START domain